MGRWIDGYIRYIRRVHREPENRVHFAHVEARPTKVEAVVAQAVLSGPGLALLFRYLPVEGHNAVGRSFTWSIHSMRSAVRASSTTMARSWLTSTRSGSRPIYCCNFCDDDNGDDETDYVSATATLAATATRTPMAAASATRTHDNIDVAITLLLLLPSLPWLRFASSSLSLSLSIVGAVKQG